MSLVKEFYPTLNLNEFKNVNFKKTQSSLKSMLHTLFLNEEVLEEYKHPEIVSSLGNFLELDYFMPKFQLAVEYQVRQVGCFSNAFRRGINIFMECCNFIKRIHLRRD
jgi:hypothetical protein